ncbi:histidine ammonia-lyase-like [Gigantopelta aegis]|uniref:histidine ammonia-lyase-like n=1 Tax=Gigantopelta aegis TaxID=1735272 RepID=UPI001B887580|nr:histidine ammonia-lyase-like [Gigantopelta aegis]
MATSPEKQYMLDGNSLTTEKLVKLGKGEYLIKLSPESEEKVNKARHVIDAVLEKNEVVYGITTGFGKFANTTIPKEKLM